MNWPSPPAPSPALAQFQADFVEALFDPGRHNALTVQPGFAVYRNTVVSGCIDALAANFPCVARLVGEPWFRGVAAEYLRRHPPHDARLLLFGDHFADFLATFDPAARDLPYLADVARLDRFWIEAHVADDAPTVDNAWLAGMSPAELGSTRLAPHPSARWGWFGQAPIYSIWQRNREMREAPGVDVEANIALDELVWQAEGALLTRPVDEVFWQRVGRAHCAFLDACAEGQLLGEAAGAALVIEPGADLAAMLAQLLRAGALTGSVCEEGAHI